MFRSLLAATVLLVVLLAALPVQAQPSRFAVELEAGPTWQSYNDVEIPNDGTATRFSLQDLAGSGPWPAMRAYLVWNINERHSLRAMAAPLSITETGVPDVAISFAGTDYAAGVATEATYRFDSYRIGYRYRLGDGQGDLVWRIGLTVKIRDAEIKLRQGDITSRKLDTGFVPLLHVGGDWKFARAWSLLLDVEALAGGPGRAEDVSLKLSRDLSDTWSVAGGYRMVEGGADVDAVYTFAWLHYAVGSVGWRF